MDKMCDLSDFDCGMTVCARWMVPDVVVSASQKQLPSWDFHAAQSSVLLT
uniref:Uncharacterized protein n=1 Tax=Anguilla anguilla TaxID=7936 RepID=A0A0E9R3C3_ANGAN